MPIKTKKGRNKLSNYGADVKKGAGGAPVSIIHQQIDIRPVHRREQSIPNWRSGLKEFESRIPRRTTAYDLFADVELDGHVEAVIEKLMNAVKGAKWTFKDKNGKLVDQVMQVIDSLGFDDLLSEVVRSKLWGYSMVEPTFFKDANGKMRMSLYEVPKVNMRPELGIIAYDAWTDEGINIREGVYLKTFMEMGNPKSLGKHMKGAPYAILKRGGVGDYAMFVQIFGEPIVDAVYDSLSEGQRDELERALNQRGPGGAVVRPKGTDLKMIANTNTANGDLQYKFISLMDKQISKTYIGTTETTEASSSSGYAQSETHQESDEDTFWAWQTYARKLLNTRFIPMLQGAGIDTSAGEFHLEKKDLAVNQKDKFWIHMSMRNDLNIPVDDDFYYEEYNVNRPDNYDELKKQMIEAVEDNQIPISKEEQDKAKEDKGDRPGSTKEEEVEDGVKLWDRVRGFFVKALSGEESEGASQTSCCGEILTLRNEVDKGYDANLQRVIRESWDKRGSASLYPDLYYFEAKQLLDAFSKGWTLPPDGGIKGGSIQLIDLGIEYGYNDPRAATAWEANIFRFSTIKASYLSAEINRLFRKATSYEEFERSVKRTYGIKNKQWLNAEYNTASAVGQSAATYFRLMEQQEIFPYWEYRTIGDERVREHHRVLHGKVLPAGHPLWDQLYPPNDWLCRCYVVPRMAGEVDLSKVERDIAFMENYVATAPSWKKAVKNGFGVNRARGMQVFTDDQQYTGSPELALIKINGFSARDYALLDMITKQERSTKTATLSNDDPGQYLDYHQRPVNLPVVARNVREVLESPDEVWLSLPPNGGNEGGVFTYIKYYEGHTRKVQAVVNEAGDLEVIDSSTASEVNRSGILIKS